MNNEISNLLGIHISSESKIPNKHFFNKIINKDNIFPLAFLVPKILRYDLYLNESFNVFAHSSFYHNLSSLEEDKFNSAKDILVKEALFCQNAKIQNLVFHPGSNLHKNNNDKRIQSLNNICEFLEYYSTLENIQTKLLLENSCGAGSQLFHSLEDFEYIFQNISDKARNKIGICLDTCHLYQAGYDISNKIILNDVFKNFQNISNNRVFLFHLNNSKAELRKHLDRHEKINLGKIDKEFFFVLSDISKANNIPMILETPSNTKERIEERNYLLDSYSNREFK